ncbi:hypothetical protein DPMN_171530 [Dreissena polymorpha]|uniref:Uncharacterized protein n=1 Tax=Dreissena polymorpha TaxID=45954 RepID=A0A9D4E0I0_DREPO|nr:hypothetical protein DPMN_171530 [Dreissena polymorpha]
MRAGGLAGWLAGWRAGWLAGGLAEQACKGFIFMPPFEEEGVYCFAPVGRSVGRRPGADQGGIGRGVLSRR